MKVLMAINRSFAKMRAKIFSKGLYFLHNILFIEPFDLILDVDFRSPYDIILKLRQRQSKVIMIFRFSFFERRQFVEEVDICEIKKLIIPDRYFTDYLFRMYCELEMRIELFPLPLHLQINLIANMLIRSHDHFSALTLTDLFVVVCEAVACQLEKRHRYWYS